MKPYLSIDIETTGLNPDTCGIIEIAAVLDNLVSPVRSLPRFHCYVVHDSYCGEPYALSMHPTIFRRIATSEPGYNYFQPHEVSDEFVRWLELHTPVGCGKLTPAGKNFSGFDKPFLDRLPGWRKDDQLLHRAIDPGSMFWDLTVDGPDLPDTKTCMERAGIEGEVAHTALDDALVVCKMIRAHWGI